MTKCVDIRDGLCMMFYMTRNSNRHHEITCNGITIHETRKNTLGGWANLLTRAAAALGGDRITSTIDGDLLTGDVIHRLDGSALVTITEVSKL